MRCADHHEGRRYSRSSDCIGGRRISNGTSRRVIGIDTGGTFTDFVMCEGNRIRLHKVPSTPPNFAAAVLQGLSELFLEETEARNTAISVLTHGSTVATNALLERKGARVALITTRGFRDVLEIGRQNRREIYNLNVDRIPPLVPRELRMEVDERVESDGTVSIPLEPEQIAALIRQLESMSLESIAVCLLFSFVSPDHERMIGRAAARSKLLVSLSSDVLPEFREFERTSTTVVNAYVSPVMRRYLGELEQKIARRKHTRLQIMQSNGGTATPRQSYERAVHTLLSGPAAGVLGAMDIAKTALAPRRIKRRGASRTAYVKIITFDMGGTSTDVSLCDGDLRLSTETDVGGYPVGVAAIDIHTVGAGGGSIARVDEGGALRVGPQSAGADPGPAAFGKSNLPTVTDANLVLGRIVAERFLGGRMSVDVSQSRNAIGVVAETMGTTVPKAARAIIDVANSNMEHAIRRVSIERGHDPREFTLLAFGGAGGLHACEIADAVEIPRVLIPVSPGNLCAWGCVVADAVKDYSRTVMVPAASGESVVRKTIEELTTRALREFERDHLREHTITCKASLDVRYSGQSFELNVPFGSSMLKAIHSFHDLHRDQYGQSAPDEPVEIVNVRLRAVCRIQKPRLKPIRSGGVRVPSDALVPSRNYDYLLRNRLASGNHFEGPILIVEDFATTFLPDRWAGSVDLYGNLLLSKAR